MRSAVLRGATDLEVTERTATADFTVFYSSQFPQLMGSLVLYTGDRELAMDLAQETMARAFRDWSRVQELDAPPAWLHRVGFNLANSFFRRKMVERRSSAVLQGVEMSEHCVSDAADAVAVRKLVAGLPKRQKTALVLRYFADMSVAEVADVMGCAEGTVRALTSQAIAALRRSGLALEDGA